MDVVYNPEVVKWLVDFFIRPHQKPDAQLRLAAKHRYEKMKQRTKEEFMRNWEQILEGDLVTILQYIYILILFRIEFSVIILNIC